MVDDAFGPALGHGHVERGQHELRPEGPGHRPPDDPAAEHVENHGEVEKAATGRDVGDISHPERIGAVGHELALDEVLAPSARRACASSLWGHGVG